jgi:hypothetical protein
MRLRLSRHFICAGLGFNTSRGLLNMTVRLDGRAKKYAILALKSQ